MPNSRNLVLTPSVTAVRLRGGGIMLSKRLLSGIAEHARHWGDRVTVLLEPLPESGLDRDRALAGDGLELDPADLPFECHILPYSAPEVESLFRSATVVMAAIHNRQLHLAGVAAKAGVPLVFVTEYTLRTRISIAAAELSMSPRLAQRTLWLLDEERRYRIGLKRAAGVQCNGVPTFEIYRHLCSPALLYFDSRISEAMVAPRSRVQARLERMRQGGVLRLGFSGRLNRMKGADELVRIARALRALGVPFTLDIWGGGVLADDIRREIHEHQLGDVVRLHGFVEFEALVPLMQEQVDVFLCSHVQGDPSSTYMEAFTNGIPVIGYANEALAGLLARHPCGATAPIRDRATLARVVAEAWQAPGRLERWSLEALDVAREHTFERTFQRRNEHLEQVVAASRR
jgi:colanic acid/amylovoran biosynthesis glycosyltransferase